MRIRKLLLIHPGRSFRALLKKYIFGELSDIDITEADCGQQALDKLDGKGFDVIICTQYLIDMELNDFRNQLTADVGKGLSNLIILSESESDQDRDQLVQQGFKRVVQIRIRPADLIDAINTVCDPRKWRKDARYHIPNTTVAIETPNQMMEAALINISLGGVLVELTTPDPCTLMNGGLTLALQIPISDSIAEIDGLTTKLLRIETVAWARSHVPKTMRATFIFDGLGPGTEGKLVELIQMVREEKLAAREVVD